MEASIAEVSQSNKKNLVKGRINKVAWTVHSKIVLLFLLFDGGKS